MTNVSPHPGFRDVLWDFIRSSPLEDTLNVRVFSSDEELFDRDDSDEGYEWRVPRGLVPRREGRRMEPLDPQTAMQAGQRLWMSLPDPVRAQALQPGPLPLRLKISGDLKEVRYLPWECLPLMPPGVVARSVPVPYPVPPFVLRQPPVRVLFVVTNPKDERELLGSRMTERLERQLGDGDLTSRS